MEFLLTLAFFILLIILLLKPDWIFNLFSAAQSDDSNDVDDID